MSIGRPFLNLTSITFNLKFYRVPNPAFAPNCASVNFWVERCGWRDVEWWRLECRREWWVWAGPRAGLGTNSRARSGAGISWADGQRQIRGRDKGRLRDARCADTRSGGDTWQIERFRVQATEDDVDSLVDLTRKVKIKWFFKNSRKSVIVMTAAMFIGRYSN